MREPVDQLEQPTALLPKQAATTRFRLGPRLLISGAVLGLIVFGALIAPWLAPYDPTLLDTAAILKGSTAKHLLGTDEFGRDLLSRLLLGARPSLVISFSATALAGILGTTLGMVAGYYRGWIEQVIMRSLDVLLTFPPILLAMMIVGFLGSGLWNLILVIGVLYAPTFGRLAYGSTLSVAELEFVEAASALGTRRLRILLRHLLPNILAPLIVQASLTIAAAILLESGLSFLGLGVKPPTPSWGLMIDSARKYMLQSPSYLLFTAAALVLVVLTVNVFGDALRDRLDKRL